MCLNDAKSVRLNTERTFIDMAVFVSIVSIVSIASILGSDTKVKSISDLSSLKIKLS